MASIGNAGFDLADQRTEEERRALIEKARAVVRGQGTPCCDDCGQPIDDARRKAAPFARRCIDCQRKSEKASRRKCV